MGEESRIRTVRRRGASCLPWLLGVMLASGASLAPAQVEIDVEPPLIEHEESGPGAPGTAQDFIATVVDDREVAEVLLFHRPAGEEAFEPVPMRRVAASSVFTATLPTDADDARAIEYYIQARDEAGNRVIKGYAFSPLVRRMGARAPGTDGATRGEPSAASGGSRRWLYIGLGVLAVGALAAMASDGGGGGGGEDTFTVTLDPPR